MKQTELFTPQFVEFSELYSTIEPNIPLVENMLEPPKKVPLGGEPDTSMLTPSQKKAANALFKFLEGKLVDENNRLYDVARLSGEAGSGKTFTMSKVTQFVRYTFPDSPILFCSPTHKSMGVAKVMSPYSNDPSVFYMTVQALCGMRPKRTYNNRNGGIEYEMSGRDSFKKYPIIIADEATMYSMPMFEKFLEHRGECKIIFVGDGEQLPPVKETFSSIFKGDLEHLTDAEGKTVFRMLNLELKEQMRATEGSPHLAHALQVRNKLPEDPISKVTPEGFSIRLNSFRREDVKTSVELKEFFVQMFTSEQFRKDPDFFRILCFTRRKKNNAYQFWTDFIRETLYSAEYGDTLPYLIPGEIVRTEAPLVEFDPDDFKKVNVRIHNNTAMEVISCSDIRQHYLLAMTEAISNDGDEIYHVIPYREVHVTFRDNDTMELVEETLKVPTEKGVELWATAKAKASKGAALMKKDNIPTKAIWEEFYQTDQETFAHLSHSYAGSVHTTQGSSIYISFLDVGDIENAKSFAKENPDFHKQLYYTGLSRSRVGNILFTYNVD